ncbi:hypothetical protein AAFF_G00105370 [Aldrovandia affinis]|uniref:Uncharacterized protein n=1 Tax=Aldrovandia affinis TaxID=143900 RepID=A0AAD7T253_9TELE|nr:hypothetical protein AAFF_G00105370 [Aldrovandia affinis]
MEVREGSPAVTVNWFGVLPLAARECPRLLSGQGEVNATLRCNPRPQGEHRPPPRLRRSARGPVNQRRPLKRDVLPGTTMPPDRASACTCGFFALPSNHRLVIERLCP